MALYAFVKTKKGRKMKKQIKSVSILQTSKVIALFYVLISLIYSFIGVLMVAFGSVPMKAMGVVYILMPLLMGGFGFLMMLLCCWLYNVIAKWVGGVEFTVETIE